MSGKRKRDYRAVFRELLELLPSPALRQVTLDFECAVWKVLRQLLPDVKLLGCVFHWTQADYVSSTWIESNTWLPSSWSVFMQSVRTNNDVEGWQLGLHTRAQGKSQLPMYLLIYLLYKEAKLTSLNVHMVAEKKLRRVQRRKYRQIQAKVFSLWGQYEEGDKTARQLLKACSLLVGPRGA
nr:uncharacterized protein LOC131780685 [Pocillopora verrucosa]